MIYASVRIKLDLKSGSINNYELNPMLGSGIIIIRQLKIGEWA